MQLEALMVATVGCKNKSQVDFEERCKVNGGHVTYDRTDNPKVVYVRCRYKAINTW